MDREYVEWLKGEIDAKHGNEVWAQEELDRYLAEQERLEAERPDREREAAEQAERDRRAAEIAEKALPLDYFPKLYAEACSVMRSSMIGPDDPTQHPLKLNDSATDAAVELWARIDRDLADDPGGALSAKANIKTKLLDQEAAQREAGDDVVQAIGRMTPVNTTQWTSGRNPKPKCRPLSREVGRRVSSTERDKAFAAYQQRWVKK